jgi:hypothetical protein
MAYQKVSAAIGKTTEGHNIFAFTLIDEEPHRIWIGKAEDPDCYYVTVLADGGIAIETQEEASAESLKGIYFGDFNIVNWDQVERFGMVNEPDAAQWLAAFAKSAYCTSESTHWDNVSRGYYTTDDLPPHLFWSQYAGWVAGPGYDEGRLDQSIKSPETELYPIFDVSGRDNIRKLRDCLEAKLDRQIHAHCPLKHSESGGTHQFGKWEFGHGLADCEDAIAWLNSLSGKSVEPIRQAELDTIAQIDLWLAQAKEPKP